MASEKLGITQWGTQFVLGSLRDFIDEGIESPGIGEAIKNRKAAILKFFIELTRANLPRKPKFQDLDPLPPPIGILADLLNVNENESLTDNTEQLAALLKWIAEGVSANDHATAVMISRRMGLDP